MRAMTPWVLVAVQVMTGIVRADESKTDTGRPPWQRLLQGDDAKTAAKLGKQIEELMQARKWSDAGKIANELAALRADKQGKDHWEAVNARWQAVAMKAVQEAPPDKQRAYAGSLRLEKEAEALEAGGKHATALPLRQKRLAVCREVLGEDHADTAQSYSSLAANQHAQGRYAKAEVGFRKTLAIHRKVLGEEHPDTANTWNSLAVNQHRQGKYTEAEEGFHKALAIFRKVHGEEHYHTAIGYNSLAVNQQTQGKYVEAEAGLRKALAIRRKVHGEEHPNTATSYNNLAFNQNEQGKYAEAERGYRKALAIHRKVFGEEHPQTATSYNNLASNQQDQGKHGDAEDGYHKALVIFQKMLGEEHPLTATSYNNLADNQQEQGKYVEAEAGFRKALAIRRKVFGEGHPSTATTYNNLALNQAAQGKYAEAEAGFRMVLSIRRKLFGEEHATTASSHNNLASNQRSQKKYSEAERGYRKALVIRRKVLGELHPLTAQSYNNLAFNQHELGNYGEAEEGYRKALTIRRKVLGEDHPDTANSYNNLAGNQAAQGKYGDAEEGFRMALTIRRKIYGEVHPTTGTGYHNLAANLNALGKYTEAEELATKAADIFDRTRLQIAATGLDRATVTSEGSPLPLLAALLARRARPAAAWQRLEESLGRGTGDDLAAQRKRPAAERQRQAQFLARLRLLDAQLHKLAAIGKPTSAHKEQRQQLLDEQLRTQDALAKFSRELEEKYGPVAGRILQLPALRKALPANAAFLVWLDREDAHWVILLKASGAPVWVRLPGTGAKKAWTKADHELPAQLYQALTTAGALAASGPEIARSAAGALAERLQGIRQLIVLPSAAMDRIPIEVIAEDLTVSYALSASLFAHQTQQPRLESSGLVALGDPQFRRPEQPELPLPPGGLLLTVVPPRSTAALAGLKTGDVLLQYGGVPLNALADLQLAMSGAVKAARIKVWRLEPRAAKAKELSLRSAGNLGALLAPDPAPKALAAQRRSDKLLAARDGIDWQPLPGTRYEVSALKQLFAAQKPTILLDSDASETKLTELVKDGRLGKARFVHLATHGQARSDKPLGSRIILSRDHLSEGQSGELSAEQVLTGWTLNAELVTLSACQTGLGKYEHGEGFVGFAQALLLTGARSVCLSRWSVNDLSTALLMERFYQNLLGKRPGQKTPLGKAAALAEAKQWLRTLPRAEALKRAEAIGAGVEPAPGAKELPRVTVPVGTKDEPPYAHAYFWAGFVLVGDPD